MRSLMSAVVLTAIFGSSGAIGQESAETPADMPWFFAETMPQAAHRAAWDEYTAIMRDETEIDAKHKELIAIAVAATIPCGDCVLVHRAMASQAGASEDEIKEALAAAAQVRKWSTLLEGAQIDRTRLEETVGAGD